VSAFELTALFISLVALGGWVNARTLRLPHAVAMLLVGLAGAGVVAGLNAVRPALGAELLKAVESVDFAQAVLGYMLAFLLFAGAMQVSLPELRKRLIAVASLATLGVAASTFVVGFGLFFAAQLLGLDLSLPWAFVFAGAVSTPYSSTVQSARKKPVSRSSPAHGPFRQSTCLSSAGGSASLTTP